MKKLLLCVAVCGFAISYGYGQCPPGEAEVTLGVSTDDYGYAEPHLVDGSILENYLSIRPRLLSAMQNTSHYNGITRNIQLREQFDPSIESAEILSDTHPLHMNF